MSKVFRATAGVFSDEHTFSIRVVGPDRARFLNGMLSNSVLDMQPGQGRWAVKATHKGRIEGLVRVRARADAFVLDVAEPSAERVAGQLNDYIVADDCELEDETPERDVVYVFGTTAESLISDVIDPQMARLADVSHAPFGEVTVVAERRFDVPGFELHVPAGHGSQWHQRLVDAGAAAVSREDFDVLRVESKVPADGPELNLDTFPMEARLDYAIDYRKGCYIGQEVITRATTQGAVKHRLTGFDLGSDPGSYPAAGTRLWPEEGNKPAGELTTVVWSPAFERALGLGFVRAQYEAAGTKLWARAEGAAGQPVVVR